MRRLDSMKKALGKVHKAQHEAKACELCSKEFGL